MNIVVTGFVTPLPVAGLLWHYAQYLLGFREAGHQVWYVEDSGDHPVNWDADRNEVDEACLAGSAFLARELGALGFGDRWVYRHWPSGRHDGLTAGETADVLAEADVLVSVSCTAARIPEYERIPVRIAVDTDPVFTQVKIAQGRPHWGAIPDWHTRLFTFGRPPLPAQQHEWVATRQPVDTAAWPVAGAPAPASPFTTVANWRSYAPLAWEGREYGLKDRSVRAMLDLPARVPVPLRVALGAEPLREEGRAALAAAGWEVVDGEEASRSTEAYRSFITSSAGELGLAKHGYVAARAGWFSERTCLYLAAGRPAVVQDTGWTEWLPHGEGLLAFDTVDGARHGIEQILADPDRHARAARRLVDERFRAVDVCNHLLEAAS